MFYYIFGIALGLILIINSILLIIKKTDLKMNLIFLLGGIALIATIIVGFFIKEEYEFIIMLILLTITASLFLVNFLLKKKSN